MPHASVRKAWWGTMLMFLLHGLIVGTWVSRIPAVKSELHLSNAVFGFTLLSSAFGALMCIPFTGGWIHRLGSRTITGVSAVAFALTLLLLPVAVNAGTLALGLLCYGASSAAMDVAMNAQGVEVERLLNTPTMSRFHAMFSVGAMAGAGAGGYAASINLSPKQHFIVAAVVLAMAAVCFWPLLLPSTPAAEKQNRPLRLNQIPPVLLALTGIGFCMLLSEGAIADWAAIYLKQILHAGPGTAAAGYATFSAAMATFRFVGDWITLKLGPFRALRYGALLAALGLTWVLFVPTATWALPGFVVVGAGLSITIPLVFGSGGRVEGISPGVGIATVTGIGYIGFIVGPPTIGLFSQWFTLRFALGLVVLCCLVTAVLSGAIRGMRAVGSSPAPEPI